MHFSRVISTSVFISTLTLSAFVTQPSYAGAFQGLTWGTSTASIKEKFPSAKESPTRTEKSFSCETPGGSTYSCTSTEWTCQRLEKWCHPSLVVSNYTVGTYPFKLTFDLSKAKTMSEVHLSFSSPLVGRSIEEAKNVYETLQRSLDGKYGKPYYRERYVEQFGSKCSIQGTCLAGASSEWHTKDTKIVLQMVVRFDPNNDRRIVDINTDNVIEISYSPLIDSRAEKL